VTSRVASIGNANIDLTLYVRKLPDPGTQVEAYSMERLVGGAAANFAVAASRLGLQAAFIGCVGRDEAGKLVLSKLRSEGVDTSLVKVVEGGTGLVVVVVDERGERTMIAYRGANEALCKMDLSSIDYSAFSWLHASSVKPEVVVKPFRKARELGVKTSYDPGGIVARMGYRSLMDALRYTDVLLLNETEAGYIEASGGGVELEVVREVVPLVVVKLGARGALAYKGPLRVQAEAFRVEVVDTTGAGDAFNAGLCYALESGLSVHDALVFANACAAIKITRRGAQASPRLREVVDFLRSEGFDYSRALSLFGRHTTP